MAGYSGTPLAKKLGIKEGSKIFAVDAPRHYLQLLAPLPAESQTVSRLTREVDIVHVFSMKKVHLAKALKTFRHRLRPDAAIWVSWPKRGANMPTDVTEDTVREVALPLGLVDIKVCAIDETWSGLKLVIRKELRDAGRTRERS